MKLFCFLVFGFSNGNDDLLLRIRRAKSQAGRKGLGNFEILWRFCVLNYDPIYGLIYGFQIMIFSYWKLNHLTPK